jgi:hypothetical protein
VAGQHQAFAASGINLATGAHYQQVHLPRSAFDDTKGSALIDTYATASSRLGIAGQSKAPALYLAFGAAGRSWTCCASPMPVSCLAAATLRKPRCKQDSSLAAAIAFASCHVPV